MSRDEFHAGEAVPQSGPYVALNVLGSPSGAAVVMRRGETFPALPRGFTWKPLAAYSICELRERAAYYRQMASTASTEQVMEELLKLAQRFDALADKRVEVG